MQGRLNVKKSSVINWFLDWKVLLLCLQWLQHDLVVNLASQYTFWYLEGLTSSRLHLFGTMARRPVLSNLEWLRPESDNTWVRKSEILYTSPFWALSAQNQSWFRKSFPAGSTSLKASWLDWHWNVDLWNARCTIHKTKSISAWEPESVARCAGNHKLWSFHKGFCMIFMCLRFEWSKDLSLK